MNRQHEHDAGQDEAAMVPISGRCPNFQKALVQKQLTERRVAGGKTLRGDQRRPLLMVREELR